MPTYIHRNAVDQSREENDQIAIGAGGRLKLTRSVALTTDYYYNVEPKRKLRVLRCRRIWNRH